MVLITFVITIVLSMATLIFTAPVADVDITPLNFPAESLTALLDTRTESTTCPSIGTSCGVITFDSGQYVSFNRGVCMQIAGKIQSIYVGHCYCSLWNTCTGHSRKDVYVDGMMLCEKPKMVHEFPKKVNYISCG